MRIRTGDIIIWILVIVSVVVVLWYLFGNSPTLEQVILTFLLTAIFTIVINVSRSGMKMNYIERDLGILRKDIGKSFDKIKEDMDLIKNKLKVG